MDSNVLSHNSFMIPNQIQNQPYDKKNELIYEISNNKNAEGNLLKLKALPQLSSVQTPVIVQKKNYVLPKRNPFIAPQLQKHAQSMTVAIPRAITKVTCEKVKSNPIVANTFSMSKVKTVKMDIKQQSQVNINSINSRIIEFNKVFPF